MKQTFNIFTISKNDFIEWYLPSVKEKFNYYYKPTKKLHRFDKIKVDLLIGEKRFNLYDDELQEALLKISGHLKLALAEKNQLPPEIPLGNMVLALNESYKEIANSLYEKIDLHQFWVWSSIEGPQTFMYSYKDKIYLEIGFIWEWLYDEPDLSASDYISYEKFIENYEPILVQEITYTMAKNWLEQCENLKNETNISF